MIFILDYLFVKIVLLNIDLNMIELGYLSLKIFLSHIFEYMKITSIKII